MSIKIYIVLIMIAGLLLISIIVEMDNEIKHLKKTIDLNNQMIKIYKEYIDNSRDYIDKCNRAYGRIR